MNADDIVFGNEDGIATITLANPEKLNALSGAHYARLRELLGEVRADSRTRALVITGTGRAFCVGADLDFLSAEAPGGASLGERTSDLMWSMCNPFILELQELTVPTLAAINGPVAGAGVGIALATDVVIAARSAYFYLPFAPRLGIMPDLGTTWFLPRLLGRARSLGAALLGDRISAEQAESWGMIWTCVDDAALGDRVRDMAARLAALPPGIALELRRAVHASGLQGLAAQLDFERERQRTLLDSPCFHEGVEAFRQKRPPRFWPD